MDYHQQSPPAKYKNFASLHNTLGGYVATFVWGAIALMPIVLVIYTYLFSGLLVLLVLLGVLHCCIHLPDILRTNTSREWAVLAFAAIFFSTYQLSDWLIGSRVPNHSGNDYSDFPLYGWLLYILLRDTQTPKWWKTSMLYYCILSALCIAVVSFGYQLFVAGIDRPSIPNANIIAGVNIVAQFVVIVVAMTPIFVTTRKAQFFGGGCVAIAGSIILLSGTRAPLPAFGLIGIVCLMSQIWLKNKQWRFIAGIVTVTIVMCIVLLSLDAVTTQSRIMRMYSFFNLGVDGTDSSIKQRLAMWDVAWELFLQQPWLGHGHNTFHFFQNNLLKLQPEIATQYDVNPQLLHIYNQPHNQILDMAVSFGVCGILLACVAMLVPMITFIIWLCRCQQQSLHKQGLALAGIYSCLVFACGALTDSPLQISIAFSFYMYIVAVLSALWVCCK